MEKQFKKRPILFGGAMVRAILDGSKTQTRRVVKRAIIGEPHCTVSDAESGLALSNLWVDDEEMFSCPYGQPGDRLWVRETFSANELMECEYKADRGVKPPCGWTPSIHMPRWASRINLEITGVRVERLNDISDANAKAEGLKYHPLYKEWGGVEDHPCSRPDCPKWRWYETPKDAFKYLWESISGAGNWSDNPWVWVIEFKVVKSGN